MLLRRVLRRFSNSKCFLQGFLQGFLEGFLAGACKGCNKDKVLTLSALQIKFVDFFSEFAWEFCIEKWRGFLVNFFWSPSPTK